MKGWAACNKSLICNPSTRSQSARRRTEAESGDQQQGSSGSSGDDACVGGNDGGVGGNDGDVGSMAVMMGSMAAMMESTVAMMGRMVMRVVVALAELAAVGATEVARV
ncbi:unnamed protein product [Rangifer tarandus platyrhynchus]|uniref:Uncharacterized protein n=2 Tax=Rangifer tarandus platyrhynchus TaxID=3082113 RepID=A0ACB0F4Q0_RANTA|nr:unnamed protein product [Rangifer tarandus platyrhynchus]CAI9707493.1 unnamed protein product [Rangifer tarandus platyrhynchus]